jgi:CRISPR-associated protein (TIGR02584 family)
MADNGIHPLAHAEGTHAPQHYPRRVLLTIAGLTPQVVTETLYALAVVADDGAAFLPTQIRLITTSEGAERARLSLLSEDPGWLARLCRDYGLVAPAFSASDIQLLTNAEGAPLADIRAVPDNTRVADQIIDSVRALCADPDCALHVSLAGGRKTMGYYAGYALSLFGRPQDRLSHVLVSEPFENSWNFFYPTPYSRVIETHDKKLADTRDAQITLAPIPFVRLRDGLPERLLAGQASFGETIATAQRALQPPELVIDLAGQRVQVAGEIITLAAAPLAFYSLFARRCQQGEPALSWRDPDLSKAYLTEYAALVGEASGDYERAETALADGMGDDDFDQRKARTNAALRKALGPQLAAPYLIQTQGRRPRSRSRLTLDPRVIRFGPINADGGNLAAAASSNGALSSGAASSRELPP